MRRRVGGCCCCRVRGLFGEDERVHDDQWQMTNRRAARPATPCLQRMRVAGPDAGEVQVFQVPRAGVHIVHQLQGSGLPRRVRRGAGRGTVRQVCPMYEARVCDRWQLYYSLRGLAHLQQQHDSHRKSRSGTSSSWPAVQPWQPMPWRGHSSMQRGVPPASCSCKLAWLIPDPSRLPEPWSGRCPASLACA